MQLFSNIKQNKKLTRNKISLFGRHLYDDSICFANVAFFQSNLLTPLNRSLRNFNRWHVSVRNRFFGYRPQKIWVPKTTYFRLLSNSMATL